MRKGVNNSNKVTFGGTGSFNTASTSTKHVIFGDSPNYNRLGMSGYINNFYLFNRELSAAEITAIYNQ
jgi:hypothetical protein